MSYRIEYDTLGGKYEVRNRGNGQFPMVWAAVLGLILLGTGLLWPETAEKLRGMLIPGEDAQTLEAFQNLTDVLRGGGTLADAVYAFCHCVIHGA